MRGMSNFWHLERFDYCDDVNQDDGSKGELQIKKIKLINDKRRIA